MNTTVSHSLRRSLAAVAAATLLIGCGDEAPLATEPDAEAAAIAQLRAATAAYHDIDVAIADGFVLLAECEVLPNHGPTGMMYANLDRVMDGVINADEPEGLLYEPHEDGPPTLVAVDLAIPYALWTEAQPPEFVGYTFQREDQFEAWALHVWIWRDNPAGMFAESNPDVSC